MLDVGWPELLVIAIVLIVVVGPKDLPPMLRAFGKMTGRLRTMAGEFRQQFDEALKEADLDDVRKTISDAQRLNPVNSLKDAMNPLRQMGADIRNDLQKAVKSEPEKAPEISVPEPAMKLPDEPPFVAAVEEKPAVSVAEPETVAPAKPARKPRAAKQPTGEAVSTPAETPKASKPPVTQKATQKASPKASPKAAKGIKIEVADESALARMAAATPAVTKKVGAPKKLADDAKPAAVKKTTAKKPQGSSTGQSAGKPKKTSDA